MYIIAYNVSFSISFNYCAVFDFIAGIKFQASKICVPREHGAIYLWGEWNDTREKKRTTSVQRIDDRIHLPLLKDKPFYDWKYQWIFYQKEKEKENRKSPTKFPLGRQIVETNYTRFDHNRAKKSQCKMGNIKEPVLPLVAKGLKEQWTGIFQVKIRRVLNATGQSQRR